MQKLIGIDEIFIRVIGSFDTHSNFKRDNFIKKLLKQTT